MLNSNDYKLLQKLHSGAKTIVYEGLRLSDNEPVILKMLKQDYPALEDVATLEHEFYLLKNLNIPGIIKAYDLIHQKNRLVLVLEDTKGELLENLIAQGPINLDIFFKLALALINPIQELHANHIIHKDIKPANIIVDTKENKIYIIDFSIASFLLDRVSSNSDINHLEGTLAYMSPEQTGRMNMSLDQRTDLYSLGVVFYEMLTGQRPFISDDSLELVYAHLAKLPDPLNVINPQIPEQLSNIILKLLSKDANERYNSAAGLKADINECAIQWQKNKQISHFALGHYDDQSELKISQKLYGREEEIEQLLTIFKDISIPPQKTECILVSGQAGIGKSVLVQTLQKPILGNRGYYISGKFEQLQKNVPYHALIKAIQSLIKQLMSQPKDILESTKKRILDAVQNSGQVIIDIIPEVEWLIGQQPSVMSLSPVETQNRFMLVFQNFMKALVQPDKPLVIFLDDLQWADGASFKLLEFILTDTRIKNLLIIGAYRDNEVDNQHALTLFLKHAKEQKIPLQTIQLKALEVDDIEHLLEDSLSVNAKEVNPLAKLLHDKTAGNSFFVKKYLQTLNQEKMLVYDVAKMKWVWNIDIIDKVGIADNVVELMVNKIKQLSDEAQRTIAIAACIGNKFSLQMLSKIREEKLHYIAVHLIEAIQAGLVMPLDNAYKYTELYANVETTSDEIFQSDDVVFQFVHDRVQQAAYSFISHEKMKKTHLKLGELLLKMFPVNEGSDYLFETLNHLNQSLKLITNPLKQEHIAKLNLIAGKRAKASTAYETAIEYLSAGVKLLDEGGWTKHHALMFSLYKELSQCKYFCTQFDEAEKDFNLLLDKAHTDYDKAIILDLKAELYSNLGKYQDAVQALLQALSILGIKFPAKVSDFHIFWELVKIKFILLFKGKKIENLDKNLTKLEDKKDILITNLFNHLIFPVYSSDEKLFALSTCKSMMFSLQKGYSMYSLESILNYAVILAELKQYQQGLAFSHLVKKLQNDFNNKQISARDDITAAVFINHWHHHLRESFKPMQEGIVINKEVGDLHYAAGTSAVYGIYLYESGTSLPEVLDEVESSLGFLQRVDSDFQIYNMFMKHLIQFLQSSNGEFEYLQNDLENMKKLENDSTYFVAQSYCSILHYIFGEYTKALEFANVASKHKHAAIGTFTIISYDFFHALILIKLIDTLSRTEKAASWKIIRKISQDFIKLAKQCPENFEHMSSLILAEIYRVKHKADKAEFYYDRAIEAAYNNGYLQHAAVANECAALYYENIKRETIAQAYFKAAHYSYLRWGATRKSSQIEERFPQMSTSEVTINDTWSKNISNPLASISSSSSSSTMAALDLISILKANRAISSEVTLPKVLHKLMEIVLENSGAHRTALINIRDKPVVEAEGRLVSGEIKVKLDNTLLNSRDDFPHLLLNYVTHSKKQVIYNSADDTQFGSDNYIIRSNLKSALCIPIVHKNQVSYLLYLENTLLPGAFTNEHVQIISALAAQAAISLENAHLYATYEQFVPYQFLEQLNKLSITDVKLGDQVERTMTILFCDIRGFSVMSETMTPAEIFNFINEFLSVMEPVVREHQGFIDKYIGDALMALFIDADSALKTAHHILAKLDEFNRMRAKVNRPPINVGIGIDTGKVMLGIVGSRDRIETSVLSDTVNNASNIQHLTRGYDVQILLTAETRNALNHPEDFHLRLIDTIKIKEKHHPIEIWESVDKEYVLVEPHD